MNEIDLTKDLDNMNYDDLMCYRDELIEWRVNQENNPYLNEYMNVKRYTKSDNTLVVDPRINQPKMKQDFKKINDKNINNYQAIKHLTDEIDRNKDKLSNILEFFETENTLMSVIELMDERMNDAINNDDEPK